MFFSQLVEIGNHVVRIKTGGKIWVLNWTDIVGANKIEGFIFLRSGDRVHICKRGCAVTVHDFGDREIGVGEYSIHCGWSTFVEILRKNVVSHGGKFIDEFEGLYISTFMASFPYFHWKLKLSPEEARERKVFHIYIITLAIYLVITVPNLMFGQGEKLMRSAWGIPIALMFLPLWLFGFFFGLYYYRKEKIVKILERHFPQDRRWK